VTNDISIGLRVPTKWADKLKIEEADVAPGATAARGTVRIEDPTYAGGEIERSSLNKVTEARVREVFALIKRRIHFDRQAQFIGGGVVLTGGTAELKGIAPLAADVFGVPARVASPRPLMGPTAIYDSPRWSTAVGLVLYAQAAQEALAEISVFDRLRSKIGRIIPGL
jgi:cell division protein FtsA